MARDKKNTLSRCSQTRKYRKIFWVNTEGWTEYDYLKMEVFRNLNDATVRMPKKIHPGRTNPRDVLKKLQNFIKKGTFRKDDEAWVVIDVDTWDPEEIGEILNWAKKDSRFHVAISNPKFELFLIMHYEKANGCTTPNTVDMRMSHYFPNYNKRLSQRQFNIGEIQTAIQHAKIKRLSCRKEIPDPGMSDFYELTERLMDVLAKTKVK